MKKKLLNILLIGILVVGLTGCGNSNSISYKEYTSKNISYELPKDWKVNQKSDGSLEVSNLDDSTFNIMVTPNVTKDTFEYFGETFMVNNLKNLNYTLVNSYEKNEYGSYKAYDYEAEVMIQGKKAPVRVTTLNVNDPAITFLMVVVDDNYDYNSIYTHMLNSIE